MAILVAVSFALGSWYAAARIPPDQSEVGADSEVSARVREQLRVLIENSVLDADNPQKALIGALFASFMDEDRIEGAGPARAYLVVVAAHVRSLFSPKSSSGKPRVRQARPSLASLLRVQSSMAVHSSSVSACALPNGGASCEL
jgi:hypothetical protein